ncbi:MAG: hypothetical protein EZS28_022066 [Streblomastix strix]|uniref:Right handed beta helix domain-containing protein n=1 Tax=Streblomastix strix TaxID=222440 RepID=A0A5J4VIE5_9EUKA|nr:MAG: hypothetical protein EZS28_022066 [Streblomastix strix]
MKNSPKESGVDANDCSSSNPCKTLNANTIAINLNTENDFNVYIYDKTTLTSTFSISRASPARRFAKDSTSPSSFGNLIINTTLSYFYVIGSILFEQVNFVVSPGGYNNGTTSVVNINDCNFENIKRYNNESTAYGGVVGVRLDNSWSSFNLKNCNFTNCEADSLGITYGGAIFLSLTKGAQLSISNSTFTGCKSRYQGGSIYAEIYTGSIFTIDQQSSFIDCIGRYGGGISAQIYSADTQLSLIDGIQFKGCYANSSGGGCYIQTEEQSVVLINNAQFEDCSTSIDGIGGGIWLYMYDNQAQQVINGTSFNNCQAGNGGGMYIQCRGINLLEVTNTEMIKCIAQNGGGIYCMANSTMSYLDITSSNLNIYECSAAQGGGIFILLQLQLSNDVKNLQITSSNQILIDNCSASKSGGGMYCELNYNSQVSINNMAINECRSHNGGGIYIYISFTEHTQFIINDVLIQGCQVVLNQSLSNPTGYGGGIMLVGSGDYNASSNGLDFRRLKIYDNTASNGGQSLYVVMSKLQEWCQYGNKGEFVKGNYSDQDSNENELEGVPIDFTTFNSLSIDKINQQQHFLEEFWNHELYCLKLTGKSTDECPCEDENDPREECNIIDIEQSDIDEQKEVDQPTLQSRFPCDNNHLMLLLQISFKKIKRITKKKKRN